MSEKPRRRAVVIVLILLVAAILLLFLRCGRHVAATQAVSPGVVEPGDPQAGLPVTATTEPDERQTPATLDAPAEVGAGAAFQVRWTGPANARDYVTIVRADAADGAYSNYQDTKTGNPVTLTAPIEAGDWELRYMTSQSRQVLGRRAIKVLAASATLDAAAEAELGTILTVNWTGPNNQGDYITVVTKDTPDGRYGNYTETKAGSPLSLKLPPVAGEAELRYMTGQGAKVLARRDLKILSPEIRLDGPAEVVAGAKVSLAWSGPNNQGDYITLVPRDTPDGRYGNYADTRAGSPATITAPIYEGDAEFRYMTGQGAHVLARRPIRIVAAQVNLDAPAQISAGAKLRVTWIGPNNQGDYITLVPRGTPEGHYRAYADTTRGSPLEITVGADTGAYELRYVAGQGAKTLARRPVQVTAR